jgi:molybdopterin-guanine dinucleotide biosynthesis protein A
VIAGGRSRRMGQDKAACMLAGKPLLAHMLHRLQALGLPARVAGLRAPVDGVPADVIEDAHPDCGPLSGIETALRESEADAALVVGVDLPLLSVAFLAILLGRAERTGAAATIPRVTGAPQPLCAVYRRVLLEPVSRSLQSGDFKVMRVVLEAAAALGGGVHRNVDLFDMESVAVAWEAREAGAWPPPHLQVTNCNTPTELAFAASLLASAPML